VLEEWDRRRSTRLIVTRGAQGCSYVRGGRFLTVPPLKVEVVDTVGAGDAFNGGLAYGLSEGMGLDEAAAFAIRVSSLAVTGFGAQEGMPTLEEVRGTNAN